jgi:signal transduction histidine kinase
MLAHSIDSMSVKEREVQDRAGHWYALCIRPYPTLDDRIDGAVLVLIDIDDIKRSLEQARDYAEAIVETVGQPLLVLDAALTVRTANHAFHEAFQTAPAEIDGQHVAYTQGGVWNLESPQRAVQAAMPAAREKRLELSAELAESGSVLGDEDRLEQVFNNLLSNAIEFTPDGSAISVRCAS